MDIVQKFAFYSAPLNPTTKFKLFWTEIQEKTENENTLTIKHDKITEIKIRP